MTGRPFPLRVGRHRLEAAWWGPPPEAAPTLLLLHGGVGCVARWKQLPEQLVAATGCGVLAWSRAGYGHSDPVDLPRPLSYLHDEATQALPAVLDAAGIRTTVPIGYSDGASIALLHAGKTRDGRLLGLVLIGPHVMVEDVSVAQIAAMRDAYLTGNLRERFAAYHRDVDGAFWGWNDAWLHPDFRSWRIDGSVRSVQVPMLLVQGAEDEYGTPEQLRVIEREARSRTETLLVPGARHDVHETRPDVVLPAIAAFVARLRAGTGAGASSSGP